MSSFQKVTLQLMALTVFAVALIWISGSGVAMQTNDASAKSTYAELQAELADLGRLMLADTLQIDTDEEGIPEDEQLSPRESMFKNIKLFTNMAYQINNRYMEDIDPKELIHAGIRGMLSNLDPFSVLMEQQSYDRLMESTAGKYEGLGMQIDNRGEHIRIITPIEGTPAYSKGLQAGDEIWKIDGKSTFKMNTQDAADLMRGPAGTSVTLTIKREGVPNYIEYDVERAVIELKSVNYYGFFDNSNIGYIRLSRFAQETSNELREALADLQSQRNLEGLVFDLRSNGGGLLHQAIETANLFIDSASLVVYTKGRTEDSERRFYSDSQPLMPEGKLVILVNGGTASASEIVSGAVQDWDRGVIMGQQTYGKGLVQQVFDAREHGVALKLTTAKYYIPSGRCIQRPERDKKHSIAELEDEIINGDESEDKEDVSDTLEVEEKEIFFTKGGRVVYGGGGVVPDVKIDPETWNPIEMNLERKSMFFDFAVTYTSQHPDIGRDFEVTSEVLAEFKAFVSEKEFDYETTLEASLKEMREVVEEEEKEAIFAESMAQLEDLISKEKEHDFDHSADYIKRAIKREVISKLYGQTGMYEEMILKSDPDVKAAFELINNDKEYTRVITGEATKAEL